MGGTAGYYLILVRRYSAVPALPKFEYLLESSEQLERTSRPYSV